MLPQSSERGNLLGRPKLEKPKLSHADLHQEITKGGNYLSPKSSSKHDKQHADMKANKEDELVKYMSNLPSYLERRAKPQEKVLNVGVLEWGRLEKWQYRNKHILPRCSISSMSSSNTSSSFSTDESSVHSTRGHSWSPSRKKSDHPALQSHLMPVPTEDHRPFGEPFRESIGKFQDLNAPQCENFNVQANLIMGDKSFCNSEIKLEQFKRREMHSKIDSQSSAVPNKVKDKVASCEKMKIKNQVSEAMKRKKFQEVLPRSSNQVVTEKRNAVVLLLPKDVPKMNHSGAGNLSDLTRKPCKGEATTQRTFLETSKEPRHAELISNSRHSGPLPSELAGGKYLQTKAMGPIDAKNDNPPSERSRSVPRAAKIESNSCGSRNLEEKTQIGTPAKYAANEACESSETKTSKFASEKVRSTSPFRRFSFSMGKTSKSSGAKEGSSITQVSSTNRTGKINSENLTASGVDPLHGEKLNAKGRARSSPLRRLLDPLLKPKAVNCRNFTNQLQDSILTETACKSSEGQRHSRSDTITRCRINVSNSSQNKKYGSSAVQALLRVQVKNGLPLFTFAVDNESNILAATVKMLSASGNGDYGCIYTFFAIQEVGKKNGRWINHGGKDKHQDYVPNAVAHMKVSGSEYSHLSGPNQVDQFSIREFVLLTLDVGQKNMQAPDLQPNDEQAAIIVKIPKRNRRSSIRDRYLIDKRNLPESTLKEHPRDLKLEPNLGENGYFYGGQDISATVILPSGVHSLPNKGEPSSLIHRWKSGGACDCGGWDLGCKLRILSNRSQLSLQSSSLKGSSVSNQFELFFQGGSQDKPFFNLSPFKDGIYSVEFNSSLSLMQAFSICIAIWDSSKHCEISESVISSEERTLGQTLLNDRTSAPNPIEGEAPASYVSYPPLSPVGRV